MSKKYENVIKKNKRKVKRVEIPKKIGDYMDNLALDLTNYTIKADRLEKALLKMDEIEAETLLLMDKVKWYGYQITDNYKQIIKILRERGIYKSVRSKEQL